MFSGCSNLKEVTIPQGVTSIGQEALLGTAITAIDIPSSVKRIEYGAFQGCRHLVSVAIPEGIELEGSLFKDCTGLTSVQLPAGLETLDGLMFYNCKSLKDIVLGDQLTSIGDYCFWGCESLKSVVIPNSVTEILDRCFEGCTNMETLTIGSSVNWTGDRAFANCKNLLDVYCYATKVPVSSNTYEGSYISYTVLHVPASAIEGYRTAYNWKDFGRIEAIGETAIKDVRIMEGESNAPYYDLNGMRIAQPRKGIYIKNGKKVVVK